VTARRASQANAAAALDVKHQIMTTQTAGGPTDPRTKRALPPVTFVGFGSDKPELG